MAAPRGNKFRQEGKTAMLSYLHCRITTEDKAKLVRQANAQGEKLCVWIKKTLLQACNKQ